MLPQIQHLQLGSWAGTVTVPVPVPVLLGVSCPWAAEVSATAGTSLPRSRVGPAGLPARQGQLDRLGRGLRRGHWPAQTVRAAGAAQGLVRLGRVLAAGVALATATTGCDDEGHW